MEDRPWDAFTSGVIPLVSDLALPMVES